MSFHDLQLKSGEFIIVEVLEALGGHVGTNLRQVEWVEGTGYVPVELPEEPAETPAAEVVEEPVAVAAAPVAEPEAPTGEGEVPA